MRQNYYDLKVGEVKEKLAVLFTDLREMLAYTKEYISSQNHEVKEKLYVLEDKVDKNYAMMEQDIMELFMLKQPEVNYMKLFLCLLRVSKDLERIGDQTINFIKMFALSTERPAFFIEVVLQMNAMHTEMIQSCWEGIQQRNQCLFESAIVMDEKINHLHIKTNELIVESIDEKAIGSANGAKMIVMLRFLERLGDNIVNVCETYIDYFYSAGK